MVKLRIEILEDGGIGDVYIEESSGNETLDEAALMQAKQCRFIPAYEDGQARTMLISYKWTFVIYSDYPPF